MQADSKQVYSNQRDVLKYETYVECDTSPSVGISSKQRSNDRSAGTKI
jgi:hypothetical protein